MFIWSNNYIYFSYYCENGRARTSLGISIGKDEYNKGKIQKQDKIILARIESEVTEHLEKIRVNKRSVLKEDVLRTVNEILGRKRREKNVFVADWRQMMEDMASGKLRQKKTNKPFSEDTIKNYENALAALEQFTKDTGFKLTYDINEAWFEGFLAWTVEKDYTQGTIYNMVSQIKSFFNKMIKRHNNTFVNSEEFSVVPGETDSIALSEAEIQQLYRTKLRKSQTKAMHVFCYGCCVGLRVEDLMRINEYKVRGNVFDILTSKKEQKVTIPVHWLAKEIYELYGGTLPVFKYQTFVYHLKKICRAAGITEPYLKVEMRKGKKTEKYIDKCNLVGPHTMRRSFLTNAYLAGIPVIKLMKISGHKTESSFMRYIRITIEENAQELANHPFFTGAR